MKPFLCVSLLTCLAFSLVACQGKPPKAARADRFDGAAYPQVVGLEKLGGDLSVGEATVVPGPNPPMRVSVAVRLRDNDPQAVQFRFIFLDVAGAPTQNDFGWQYVTMQPRVQTFLTGGALSGEATQWRLELREASRNVEFR